MSTPVIVVQGQGPGPRRVMLVTQEKIIDLPAVEQVRREQTAGAVGRVVVTFIAEYEEES